jgi:hypothetical protein
MPRGGHTASGPASPPIHHKNPNSSATGERVIERHAGEPLPCERFSQLLPDPSPQLDIGDRRCLPLPRLRHAAAGAIYRRPRAVNSRFSAPVPRVPNAGLLQRPGDGAISGSIGFGVRELLLVRVQEACNMALGGSPAEFFVERGD